MTGVDELADHRDHHVDVPGRVGLHVGRLNAEGRHVVVVDLRIPRRDLGDRLAGLERRRDDLVIDVGDVTREGQFVTAPQHACEQVENDRGARVADMRIVVDGRPAQVHRHLARLEGLEGDFLSLERVVELDRHGIRSGGQKT